MKLKKLIIPILLFVVIACCVFRYYYTKPSSNSISNVPKKEIKIGAVLPLSGPVASFGKWAQKGMLIAENEINSDTSKTKIKIVFEDSKFDAKTGLAAYQKLVSSDKVDVIISAMSKVSIPILEIKDRKVPVFLQDVTYPKITEKYNNVVRHFIQSDREATVLSNFAVDSLKLKTCSILYVNDEAGIGAKKAFEDIFNKNGKVIIDETFEGRTKDVKTQVSKILKEKPECIFLFGNGPSWALSLKTIREQNYKGVILTNTAMYIPVFRKIAGEATNGVYFTYPYIDKNNISSKKFIDLYKSKYNEFPPLEAAYGYDLVKIISLSKFTNYSNTIVPNQYSGAFGRITNFNNDYVTKIALGIIENNDIRLLNIY